MTASRLSWAQARRGLLLVRDQPATFTLRLLGRLASSHFSVPGSVSPPGPFTRTQKAQLPGGAARSEGSRSKLSIWLDSSPSSGGRWLESRAGLRPIPDRSTGARVNRWRPVLLLWGISGEKNQPASRRYTHTHTLQFKSPGPLLLCPPPNKYSQGHTRPVHSWEPQSSYFINEVST